jgi:hypothetical protein
MSGAADFYYGEMEMRRWSAPWPERGLVWIYWLMSGYGLRVMRPILFWGALVAVGMYCMTVDGFDGGPSTLPRALLFSIRATLPGVATLEKLKPLGQTVEVVLRVLGPLAIALAAIAIRGRLVRKPSE